MGLFLLVATVALILSAAAAQKIAKNVIGGELGLCCLSPRTGFMRDGFCKTNANDQVFRDSSTCYSRSSAIFV